MASSDNQIELITPKDEFPPGSLWIPTRGAELQALLGHLRLDAEGKERLAAEAVMVLSKCIPPQSTASSTTGLVLGYVQSGKTLAFTALAALARDNGYPLIIVITGIATNLFGQSRDRLASDLQLQANRKWRLFENPRDDQHAVVADLLRDWTDTRLPDYRRKTVLVTVLKNGTYLRHLVGLLRELDLTKIPVLVIDDEADQAGLNIQVAKGRQSTTYQRLVALRGALPHHTYLQYTATPQAPLLVNVIDTLSPKFAELLTPGGDYVGGDVFFEQRTELVSVIPAQEIPGGANAITEPPPTLLYALRIFFLGVAAGILQGEDQQPKNRSMLVHPSRETPGHGQFHHWITQIRMHWLDILRLPIADCERVQFIETFGEAYKDLERTAEEIPSFQTIVDELEYAIRQTSILEVNARPRTPAVDWKATYPWILVGGQAMDRGFTVEGLTVTYMPRDTGVGNADTIQQRARFLGYKRRYLGFCRVFLEQGLLDAFKAYVSHERDIRDRLSAHRGRPLAEWRRAFFLEKDLRPTRRQVLDLDYRQDTFSDKWFWPKVPHGTDELLAANRETVRQFIATASWREDSGDSRRTQDQIHLIADNIPLIRAHAELLMPLRFTQEYDSQAFTGLLLQIVEYLQNHGEAKCTIYRIRKGSERLRSVNDEEEIPTLFQGANYADDDNTDMTYPGDERIRQSKGLTVQIHTLTVHEKDRGPIIANDVPAIAVWVPESMGRDWLVQRRW